MRLTPGTSLGPYEVVALLGAGGMGEVYRARDSRLGRDVALKVLPAALAADPERLARFEAEARAVAALAHPNVLALHDLGHEGGVRFTVSELVEGVTLRERLADGPLAPARAAALAAQIAHGLAAAHDRGIVHRDLKPENVMVTPDGRAKILDFGLARRDAAPGAGSQSLAPTMAASTEPGTVLGTMGYMSPEQVRGQVVDARSDLFALGVVLYELLTGRPPFRGDSPADTMTAILREEPAPLAALVPEVTPALERIVARCLEKPPAARFRTAADLAFALESLASFSSSAHAVGEAAATGLVSFRRLTFRNGHVATARFTPDGASVVYGAAWDGRRYEVFTSRIGSAESRGLGLPPANLLAMSAGGEMAVSLGYRHSWWFQVSGTLARVPLAGGGVRPLQKDVSSADWAPDGRGMAVTRYVGTRSVLEYPPGRELCSTDGWLHRCRVSPDGRFVAFERHDRTGEGEADLCVADRDGTVRVLEPRMTNLSGVAWAPSGREVWFSGINSRQHMGLWAATLDGEVRELHRTATRIAIHEVRADGRALASLEELRIGLGVGGPAGEPEEDVSWFDGSVACALSPDGQTLVFSEVAEAENPHYATYLRTLDGSGAVRLGEGIGLALSPDGQWVLAFTHQSRRGLSLYPTGFGEPRDLAWPTLEHVWWGNFHPDGRRLFVLGRNGNDSPQLHLAPLDGGATRALWTEPMRTNRFKGVLVHPDGRRVLLQREDGRFLLLDVDSGATEPVSALDPEAQIIGFDASGAHVFVTVDDPVQHPVSRVELATGERVAWARPQLADARGVVFVDRPLVAADGTRYAYNYLRAISNLYLIEGLGG